MRSASSILLPTRRLQPCERPCGKCGRPFTPQPPIGPNGRGEINAFCSGKCRREYGKLEKSGRPEEAFPGIAELPADDPAALPRCSKCGVLLVVAGGKGVCLPCQAHRAVKKAAAAEAKRIKTTQEHVAAFEIYERPSIVAALSEAEEELEIFG